MATDKPTAKAKSGKAGKPVGKGKPGKATKPRSLKATVSMAPAVPLTKTEAEAIEQQQKDRDDLGRFVSGNIGGPGRPPGARNRLTEDFVADFHTAWREHGPMALQSMATKEPSAFVRAAVQLMPKDVLLDARGAGLIVVRLDDTDLAL